MSKEPGALHGVIGGCGACGLAAAVLKAARGFAGRGVDCGAVAVLNAASGFAIGLPSGERAVVGDLGRVYFLLAVRFGVHGQLLGHLIRLPS